MLSVFNKNYNGRSIRIREDKYVCLTDMAIANGKLFADWARLKGTISYLEALSNTMGIPIVKLIEVFEGRDGGTWAHPRIAIKFASWCSPAFEVQVTIWIDELMTVGTVSIAPQPEPTFQRKLAPQRDILDYWQACQEMGIAIQFCCRYSPNAWQSN
jgi:KilA-N domain